MSGPRPIPAEERARWLSLPASAETHVELLDSWASLDDLEIAPPRRRAFSRARGPARIVAWNVERGRHLEEAARLLEGQRADVMLLSELDHGMARTGQRHTTRELAKALGCGFAYGIEFVELGLGDADETARFHGETNEVGFHGSAILSRWPLARTRLVRLDRDGRWFDGALGERRVGGRIAVLATIEIDRAEICFASVHLESHSDPEHRAAQMKTLLDAVDDFAPDTPVVIGGDVNTSSLSQRHLQDPEETKRALAEDPQRLRRPIPHEPLFALTLERGYDHEACNRVGEATLRLDEPSRRGAAHLDWFFTRGLEILDPAVVDAIHPTTRRPLSDHELIALTLPRRQQEAVRGS